MSDAYNAVEWTPVSTGDLLTNAASPGTTPEDKLINAFAVAIGLYDRELSPGFLFGKGLV